VSTPAYGVDQFVPAYQALKRSKIDFVVVGGQACALWATMYDSDKDFSHYTTKDFDACTRSKDDVSTVAKLLKVTPLISPKAAPSPEFGSMQLNTSSGAPIVIQFLRHCYGVSAKEIFATKQSYIWDKHDLQLSVMHPVLCLEDKMASLCGLDQKGRQDLKHLKMAVRFSSGFIEDLVTNRIEEPQAEKDTLGICQRILKAASSKIGLQCALKHRIAVEEAIPMDAIKRSKSLKLLKFLSTQLPRELMALGKVRKTAGSKSYL
jgi:hypothetical protein